MNVVEKMAAYIYSVVAGIFFCLMGFEVYWNRAFFAVFWVLLGLAMSFMSWLFVRD